MKILVLLSRFPYPLEKGDKLRAFHQIIRLSKSHEITLFTISDRDLYEEDFKQLSPYCGKIETFQLSTMSIFWNLIKALFSNMPFQTAYFYHSKAQRKIDRMIRENQPDVIYCQLIRMAQYTLKYKKMRKILDYMDVFSAGIKRRKELAPFYSKWIFGMEYNRTQKYEASLLNVFDKTSIISEQDRNLINHTEKNKIEIINNGVDFLFFSKNGKSPTKRFDVLFTGNMNYPPNVEAALFLIRKILPLVRKIIPNVRICIAGTNPAPAIQELKSEQVIITGWVEDIREYYLSSKVFIAPMQIGTGLQNKLLEAMAMKLPCITSTLANNALNATHNHSIMIAQTAAEYAEIIVLLLQDEQKALEIAQNGYNFVKETFNWDKSVLQLENLLKC